MKLTKGAYMLHPECPPVLISILQDKINPVLIGAAQYAIRCYEVADDKDLGFRQCTNFTPGCAFYDSCSKRLRHLANKERETFRYEVVDDQMQIVVSFEGKEFRFFTGRVHPKTRQFIRGKGKKKFLDEQLTAEWLGLPGIAEYNAACGMLVIGADFSSQNGLGKITLDYHIPISQGKYNILTIATLYGSEAPMDKFSSIPERAVKPVPTKTTAPEKQNTEKKAQAKKKANIIKIPS